MDYIFSAFVFLVTYFYLGVAEIQIVELKVPSDLQSGSADSVILDCEFTAKNEDGLEVKWFYNGFKDMIYQWLPATNKSGQASGSLKNHIDEGYKISNESSSMYRAIKIKDLTPDVSGNYTCKVSGDYNEEFETKTMIIYVPASDGLHLNIDKEECTITCTASGIYPQPEITLQVSVDNETEDDELTFPVHRDFIEDDNGYLNVTAELTFNKGNITKDLNVTCNLVIPGTKYSLHKSQILYYDSEEIETQVEENIFLYGNDTIEENNVTDSSAERFEVEENSSQLAQAPMGVLVLTLLFLKSYSDSFS